MINSMTKIKYDDQNQQIIQGELQSYMSQKLIVMRLQKEEAGIDKEPIPNALVTRDGFLNFHFCLYDLEGQYAGGLYHGLFELHENYPFNAPKLYFYTPSGRFEINLPICTSFTNYHQETWTSAWNVRSLILATISFMYSEEPSYGCRSDPEAERRRLALSSKEYNFKHTPDFDRLFGEKLIKIGKITPEERARLLGKNEEKGSEQADSMEAVLNINQQAQEEVENPHDEILQVAAELDEPFLKDRDHENKNNQRNNLTKAFFKGTAFVGIIASVYIIYRWIA